MIQELSLGKPHRRDLGEKSCTVPSGRWRLVAHLSGKPSNGHPAKSSLCLASAMENNQEYFCHWLPFSAQHQSPLQWPVVGRRNIPNYLWALHCNQSVVKVPSFCFSHNKNFVRLGCASFAKPKFFSMPLIPFKKVIMRHLNRQSQLNLNPKPVEANVALDFDEFLFRPNITVN